MAGFRYTLLNVWESLLVCDVEMAGAICFGSFSPVWFGGRESLAERRRAEWFCVFFLLSALGAAPLAIFVDYDVEDWTCGVGSKVELF